MNSDHYNLACASVCITIDIKLCIKKSCDHLACASVCVTIDIKLCIKKSCDLGGGGGAGFQKGLSYPSLVQLETHLKNKYIAKG